MKSNIKILKNNDGSVIIIALMILMLTTILGISGISSTNIEVQIAANYKFYNTTYYTSEAARAYVEINNKLYGPGNVTLNTRHYFPNTSDPYTRIAAENNVTSFQLGQYQSFTGFVEYTGYMDPPRESGYEAGEFKAHVYNATCTGYGPHDYSKRVQAGFYRIGF